MNLLLITESADTPIEVHDSLMIQHFDLTTNNEEADIIIVKQCCNFI